MKDLAWLKEEVMNLIFEDRGLDFDTEQKVNETFSKVEQPDYDTIFDEGYKCGYKTGKNHVPEQPTPSNSTGLELPVIPDYVAEYIEEQKEIANHWFECFDELGAKIAYGIINTEEKRVGIFMAKHPDDFVDAYRIGYTVEEVTE